MDGSLSRLELGSVAEFRHHPAHGTPATGAHHGPDAIMPFIGTVRSGDVFEVARQTGDWGMIVEERWVSMKYVQDL